MKRIKLMADYQSWPLWWAEEGKVGNIDPKTLNISEKLQQRLKNWSEEFDSFIDLDNPTSKKEIPPYVFEAFEQEGFLLWKELNKELTSNYEIVYHSGKYVRVFTSPEDYQTQKEI